MSRISSNPVDGTEPNRTPVVFDTVQGEASIKEAKVEMVDEKGVATSINLTNYEITAVAKVYTAFVEDGDPPFISEYSEQIGEDISLVVVKGVPDDLTLTAAEGWYTVYIPNDLWTDAIVPNIVSDVPVALVYISLSSDEGKQISIFRWAVIIRSGV